MLEYKEAVKKIKDNPVKENYMVISLSYNSKLVLKYKDGVALLNALSNAEQFNDEYSEDKQKIIPLVRGAITTCMLSAEDYTNYKVAQLLGITISELREHMKEET